MHGVHLRPVVHIGDGIENKDLLPESKRIPHLEKRIAADVVRYVLFIVIEDQDRIGLLDLAEVLADKIVFDFSRNSRFVRLGVNETFGIHKIEAFGYENRISHLLKLPFDAAHFFVKLHTPADSDGHIIGGGYRISLDYSGLSLATARARLLLLYFMEF